MQRNICCIIISIIFAITCVQAQTTFEKTYYWSSSSVDNAINTGYIQSYGYMGDQSSLGHLIMLGDFVVVNIRQSEITPAKPGSNFGTAEVIRAALTKINSSGGLKTIYGHDHLDRSDILITRRTVPGYVAITLPAVNMGKVENKGCEFSVNWDDKIDRQGLQVLYQGKPIVHQEQDCLQRRSSPRRSLYEPYRTVC